MGSVSGITNEEMINEIEIVETPKTSKVENMEAEKEGEPIAISEVEVQDKMIVEMAEPTPVQA